MLCERLARSLRIPDIVLFLLLGMIARPVLWQMLGIAPSSLAIRVGLLLGAAILVFEGGHAVDRSALAEVYVGATLLATLGVFLSFAVVAVSAHLAFGLSWPVAALCGAILAATDPASVAPLLEDVRVVARLQDLLLLESAANDATSAALAVSLQGGIAAP
ncbi:Cation/H+ exchanger, partial [mine drainage metagenome]